MNRPGIGIDLSGDIARMVRITPGESFPSFTLRTFPDHQLPEDALTVSVPLTIVTEDQVSNVRIVRPAIVVPLLSPAAAEYEARIAMLADETDLNVSVHHIGNSRDPRAWLAISNHPGAAVKFGVLNPAIESAHPIRYLPRSVALGRGYLFGCESDSAGLEILVECGKTTSSICFISNRTVIGTASVRGIAIMSAGTAELSAWVAELQMVAQYRLSTDLHTVVGSIDPCYVLVGDPDLAARLRESTGAVITPARHKLIAISPDSEVSSLSAGWLAALGAALN
jgi:hypothetical protein